MSGKSPAMRTNGKLELRERTSSSPVQPAGRPVTELSPAEQGVWLADRLRAGVVWANTFNKFDPTSPFGGYRESGYGREGGRHGLEAYLNV